MLVRGKERGGARVATGLREESGPVAHIERDRGELGRGRERRGGELGWSGPRQRKGGFCLLFLKFQSRFYLHQNHFKSF